MNTTRRNFIGSALSAVAIPLLGFASSKTDNGDDWFEDLMVDRYYTLHGGPYGDTGGWGSPYPQFGAELMEELKYWYHCRELEDNISEIENRGYYLSQSQYFGKPFRFYNNIPLTKKWLMEFYHRHKDDTSNDWQKRYDDYYDSLQLTGWKVDDDYILKG